MKRISELTPEEFILPPLHQAARQRDLEALRDFLVQGEDVNGLCERIAETGEGGNSPLWFAAQGLPGNNVPTAEALLEAGANIDQPGEFNMTPIHMACSWGHVALVEFLHSRGACLDVIDDYGRTPIELARKDYAAGLETPEQERSSEFSGWLEGMGGINRYFDSLEK